MIKGGIGGGSTLTGLHFENERDLLKLLASKKGYEIKDEKIGKAVYFENKLVANIYRKHDLYKFLTLKNIDWKAKISKKLLPDDALYVIINNTLYIIELKFQNVAGSVDEKLQTCDFKKKQYQKLLSELNVEVKYIYVLSDWFKKQEYKDVLDYIISVNCDYYFDYIPLQKLGLPVPEDALIEN
jgi:hypothetical protein